MVRAWKPGTSFPRRALAVISDHGKTYEAVIDLGQQRLVSYKPVTGEPAILLEEVTGATDIAIADARMIAGLAKRGLKPAQVYCLPLTAGAFGLPDESGRRLMKVPCYVKPSGSNYFAKPIEGLFATIDLKSKSVLEVTDTGVVPVPEKNWGYAASETAAYPGGRRAAAIQARPAQDRQFLRSRQPDSVGYLAPASARRQTSRRGAVAGGRARRRAMAIGRVSDESFRSVCPLHGPGQGLVFSDVYGQRRIWVRQFLESAEEGHRLSRICKILHHDAVRRPRRSDGASVFGVRFRAKYRRPGLAPFRNLRSISGEDGPGRGSPGDRTGGALGFRGGQLRLPDRLHFPAGWDHSRRGGRHRNRFGKGRRFAIDEGSDGRGGHTRTAP